MFRPAQSFRSFIKQLKPSVMKPTKLCSKALFISIIFSFCIHLNAQFNSNLATKLQDTLDGMIAAFTNTKGMSAAVYLPGQGIWTGNGGFSHAGNPITSDMIFGMASNSKLYTSVIMLKLQENNILDLDDPISNWLPPYPNVNPAITIRQLLNHTSGVSDPFFTTGLLDTVKAHPTQVYTPNDIIFDWLGAPAFAPGGGYQYSNVNYILAGMVAESATGYHISQLIRDSILTPLQLDSTFYDIEEPITGILAHRWEAGADLNDTSRISLNTAGGCAGAMFSTAAEMAQWYHALMNGEVINPVSLNEMTTFLAPGNYGLGILTQPLFTHTTWGHSGGTWGYRSKVIYDPCMKAVIVGLVNNSEAAEQGMTALLYKVLLDYLPTCPGAISGTANICPGTTGVVYTVPSIAGATSYVWTLPGGATGVSATNSITVDFTMAATSGNISVCGMNAYGVGATSTFYVNVNHVDVGVTQAGNSLMVDSLSTSYQWADCNNAFQIVPGATTQIFISPVEGDFAAIITQGGCIDTSGCFQIDFSGVGSYDNGNIHIYPNPSNGMLKVDVGNINATAIMIHHLLGELVLTMSFNQGNVDLTSLPSGTYVITVISDEKEFRKKIIIQ
jgi:D-alanyl-D-alanine carboxypeptidase